MDIIIDTIKDTFLIIPILFIMYLCLEYFEHKNISQSMTKYLTRYGPLIGAILGIIPQCGFGVLASLLFINKRISLGTLISVFIATSDEAIPILLTNPQLYTSLLGIILTKFILAIIVGYLVDILLKPQTVTHQQLSHEHCHEHSIAIEAMIRTFKIYTFIFLVNIVLSTAIEIIGPKTLSYILLDKSIIQPIVSAIFGFIPNCAASVILTQLHVNGILSFASLLAGLITNAGLGILVLLQNRIDIKTLIRICTILLLSALIVGLPLQWFFLY
ncbi:putative manganese transporter [Candidatus Stoquefichus massiliensis]|uniref:putative manganese transporter n=1 Tax=Candidatus Stoquefichus massiliensis TaxID=1470350 RepID=UPI00048776DF|nr:putative manganese transporter [Candidatus Stoquefichus massiliensis]